MEPITVGMTVRSLDDRTVGQVNGAHLCCVGFTTQECGQTTSATWAGVYNVHNKVVSLIYISGEPHRYVCPAHLASVRKPTYSATGWPAGAGPRSTQPHWMRLSIGREAEHSRLTRDRRAVVAGR